MTIEQRASYEILHLDNADLILSRIEAAARVCYKSASSNTKKEQRYFIRKLIENGHESVIEHEKATVRFICDRGVSHEIVRHRLASYSQESTRYCNYHDNKFASEITVILPSYWGSKSQKKKLKLWRDTMVAAERAYMQLVDMGASAQEARSVLPNSLKTEIVITMNFREWRHFFRLRTSKKAHPQMREIACPLLLEFKRRMPVLFDDIRVAFK